MVDATNQLVECSKPKLTMCGEQELLKLSMEFNMMSGNASKICNLNFSEEFIKGINHSQCLLPLCSHDDAKGCLNSLQPSHNETCG